MLNKAETNSIGFFQKQLTPWSSVGLTFSFPFFFSHFLPSLGGRGGETDALNEESLRDTNHSRSASGGTGKHPQLPGAAYSPVRAGCAARGRPSHLDAKLQTWVTEGAGLGKWAIRKEAGG